MSKLQYHRAMTTIVTHSLLHLYTKIGQKKGYMPIKQRNELLVKFLKPRLKLKGYAIAKKDIKALIQKGREANANLERQLWKLNDINNKYASKFTEADELYILLNDLYQRYGYVSQIASDDCDSGIIYMEKEQIEQGFDENNQQTKTLKMFIKTDEKPDTLIKRAQSITRSLVLAFDHERNGIQHYNIDRAEPKYEN